MKVNQALRRLEFGVTGWTPALVGGFFAAMGGAFVYWLLIGGEVTVNGRAGGPADAWMPALFVLLGVGIMGLRGRSWIDRDSLVLFEKSGWMMFTRLERTALAGTLEDVVVEEEWRRTDSGSRVRYEVYLRTSEGRHDLFRHEREGRAVKAAKMAADFLDIPYSGSVTS